MGRKQERGTTRGGQKSFGGGGLEPSLKRPSSPFLLKEKDFIPDNTTLECSSRSSLASSASIPINCIDGGGLRDKEESSSTVTLLSSHPLGSSILSLSLSLTSRVHIILLPLSLLYPCSFPSSISFSKNERDEGVGQLNSPSSSSSPSLPLLKIKRPSLSICSSQDLDRLLLDLYVIYEVISSLI